MKFIPFSSTSLKHTFSVTDKCIYAYKSRFYLLYNLLIENEIQGLVFFKANCQLPESAFIINELSGIFNFDAEAGRMFIRHNDLVSITYRLVRMFMT